MIPFDIFEENALIERLVAGSRDRGRSVVFLVGAPLTAPLGEGNPGVPGVAEMIRRVQQVLGRSLEPPSTGTINSYQHAFLTLGAHRGPDAVNKLIRQAVLSACCSADEELCRRAEAGYHEACQCLEEDTDGWSLSPGVESLGRIVSAWPEHFGQMVLTSNFDPLIGVSVRNAGGKHWRTALHGDGYLEQSTATGCHIVHVHGYWYGTDTLHTPAQLVTERPQLRASLVRLFQDSALVVVAYGGWEDVFTRTLADLVLDEGAFPEVMWTFYESSPDSIASDAAQLLERLRPGLGRYRVMLYGGIDCHTFFPKLWQALQTGEPQQHSSGRPAIPADTPEPAPVHPGLPSHISTIQPPVSPFVVGPVIDQDVDFFGRHSQRDLLYDALFRGQSAQILGERRMGKTSLLRWVQRHARDWQPHPVAYINAQGLGGRSPSQLVRAAAHALGRDAEVREVLDRHAAEPDPRAAERALASLVPALLLVDEASALIEPGHGFDSGFLDVLRDLGQQKQLVWISTSHRNLHSLFESTGLTSTFLNDSRDVWVGQLEPDAAQDLLARGLDQATAGRVIGEVGAFPYGLQWLADALWRGREFEQACDAFARALEPLFQRWLQGREPEERELLRRCVAGLDKIALSDRLRRKARDLVDFGLLCEEEGFFTVPGVAWQKAVLNA